jgi:hypothetical protein
VVRWTLLGRSGLIGSSGILLLRQVKMRHSIGKYLLPPSFFFSVRPHAIYYLGTLRLNTKSYRLFSCPGSKMVLHYAYSYK